MEFDLRQVTWGYQEIFRQAIAELEADGLVGSGNEEATRLFYEVLGHADKSTFDSVLKSFLDALCSEHRWVMRLPRLFGRWSGVGLRLARRQHFLGRRFFEHAGCGRLGRTPREVELALDLVELLEEREPELVGALLEGFALLTGRLTAGEVRKFVLEAVRLFRQNPKTGRHYLAVDLTSARRRVELMTRQASLTRQRDGLERLARGLLGRETSVNNLGALDSDELLLRGSLCVACRPAIYVPETITQFGSRQANEECLKALVAIAAATQLARGFSSVHGAAGLETCRNLFVADGGEADVKATLFCLVETKRLMDECGRRLPGLRAWLRRFRRTEFEIRPARGRTDALLAALLGVQAEALAPGDAALVSGLRRAAERGESFADSAGSVRQEDLLHLSATGPRLEAPRPLFFLPDPFFPLTISGPAADALRLDLRDSRSADRDEAQDDSPSSDRDEDRPRAAAESGADASGPEDADSPADEGTAVAAGYFYDEWNVHCLDYYRDWCCVRERRPEQTGARTGVSGEASGHADRVRRIFERLKPQQVREETRLLEGDSIHLDHFVEYVSQRDVKHDTDMRFYNKPITRKRDVAVALLIDLSGSTAEPCAASGDASPPEGARRAPRAARTVLEVEKEAAFVLASGLSALGDSFGVFGFTGTGRENCVFSVFKDFDESWGGRAVASLLGAAAGSSTRIGAALRHAGWKLGRRPARTKLLLLITDGKPCDQGYDVESHYAQHDVHKACQENRQADIHTFCISTAENTPADMELMFPRGRYMIVENIGKLPAALSHAYLRLTR